MFVFGPRGVGKSQLLAQLRCELSETWLVDLLHSDTYTHYLTAPQYFRHDVQRRLDRLPSEATLTVLVDEVQKLPNLLDEVHFLYERNKPRLRFLLTGSSARKLKTGGANLLAGRALTLHLHPLVHTELQLDLMRALQHGTLPAVYLEDSLPELTLKSYVQTYLKEEVLQEALVRRIDGFTRFLDLAGQYHGEPVNFSRIAKAARVSPKTVQQYYQILLDTLVAFRFGRLFETFLILECFRLNDYRETDFRFWYWRTNNGMEVDLVVQRGIAQEPLAVEVKSDAQPQRADLTGLLAFQSDNPGARLVCAVGRILGRALRSPDTTATAAQVKGHAPSGLTQSPLLSGV